MADLKEVSSLDREVISTARLPKGKMNIYNDLQLSRSDKKAEGVTVLL